VLGAELQHFLGFADAAGAGAGDGAAFHQQWENGKRRGTVWRTQKHENGVAFEQVDVGVDIVIRRNGVQDQVEATRVGLHGLRVVGHDHFVGTEAQRIYASDRQEVWRETSGAPRTAFAAHTYNEAFHLLGAHPRLIRPVEQVFGEQLYMHQYKINAKAAFEGDVWQWHQDYGTWARDDGMPEPRAMNIAVFMDEVMPINGPLMLVPRSHQHGVLSAGHDEETTSYPLWTLDKETVTRLVDEGGIVAPTGQPGSVLMFHGNLVHGSAPNITPYPRRIVYLTLCAVSNYIRKPTRPEWIAHRDFTPIEPVPESALLDYARAYKVAAE